MNKINYLLFYIYTFSIDNIETNKNNKIKDNFCKSLFCNNELEKEIKNTMNKEKKQNIIVYIFFSGVVIIASIFGIIKFKEKKLLTVTDNNREKISQENIVVEEKIKEELKNLPIEKLPIEKLQKHFIDEFQSMNLKFDYDIIKYIDKNNLIKILNKKNNLLVNIFEIISILSRTFEFPGPSFGKRKIPISEKDISIYNNILYTILNLYDDKQSLIDIHIILGSLLSSCLKKNLENYNNILNIILKNYKDNKLLSNDENSRQLDVINMIIFTLKKSPLSGNIEKYNIILNKILKRNYILYDLTILSLLDDNLYENSNYNRRKEMSSILFSLEEIESYYRILDKILENNLISGIMSMLKKLNKQELLVNIYEKRFMEEIEKLN